MVARRALVHLVLCVVVVLSLYASVHGSVYIDPNRIKNCPSRCNGTIVCANQLYYTMCNLDTCYCESPE
jgi:hypothetical protein